MLSCRSPLPSRSPLSSAPAVGSLPRRPRRTISVDRSWIPHGVGGRQRALTAYDGAQAGRRQLAASWSPEFARRVDRSSGPPPWNHVPSPSPTVRAAGGAVARRHPAAPHGAPSRATATPLLIGPDAAGCRPEHPLHPRAIAVLYTVYVLQLKWLSNHVGKSRGFAPDIGAMTRVPGQRHWPVLRFGSGGHLRCSVAATMPVPTLSCSRHCAPSAPEDTPGLGRHHWRHPGAARGSRDAWRPGMPRPALGPAASPSPPSWSLAKRLLRYRTSSSTIETGIPPTCTERRAGGVVEGRARAWRDRRDGICGTGCRRTRT